MIFIGIIAIILYLALCCIAFGALISISTAAILLVMFILAPKLAVLALCIGFFVAFTFEN